MWRYRCLPVTQTHQLQISSSEWLSMHLLSKNADPICKQMLIHCLVRNLASVKWTTWVAICSYDCVHAVPRGRRACAHPYTNLIEPMNQESTRGIYRRQAGKSDRGKTLQTLAAMPCSSPPLADFTGTELSNAYATCTKFVPHVYLQTIALGLIAFIVGLMTVAQDLQACKVQTWGRAHVKTTGGGLNQDSSGRCLPHTGLGC